MGSGPPSTPRPVVRGPVCSALGTSSCPSSAPRPSRFCRRIVLPRQASQVSVPLSTHGGTLHRTWIKSVCVRAPEPGSRSGPGGSLAWVPRRPQAPQVLGSWSGRPAHPGAWGCSCIRSVPASKAPARSPAFRPISLTGGEGLPGGKEPPPAPTWVWPGRKCPDSPHELHIWASGFSVPFILMKLPDQTSPRFRAWWKGNRLQSQKNRNVIAASPLACWSPGTVCLASLSLSLHF